MQLKMLLTRIGEGSKIVITGDTRQADRKDADNGLLNFRKLVSSYEKARYVAGIEFDHQDIQRHPAVAEVLKIYGEF
jgi:phosphate starvation-inducible protein PhoH and related proteins